MAQVTGHKTDRLYGTCHRLYGTQVVEQIGYMAQTTSHIAHKLYDRQDTSQAIGNMAHMLYGSQALWQRQQAMTHKLYGRQAAVCHMPYYGQVEW